MTCVTLLNHPLHRPHALVGVLLFLACLALSVTATLDRAGASERVAVRTALHDGFGRIVFSWKRLPAFDVRQAGADVVITFDRPLAIDPAPLVGKLGGEIAGAALSGDGRTLTLRRARAGGVRAFPLANMAVVDLLGLEAPPPAPSPPAPVAAEEVLPPAPPKPTRWAKVAAPSSLHTAASDAASAPSAPSAASDPAAPSAPAAASAPSADDSDAPRPLRVDARDYRGFSRLIFNAPMAVDYQVRRAGDIVTVRFPADARLDADALRANLPRRFLSVDVRPVDEALLLRIVVPELARLRHFQKGNRVVLDVLDPAVTETAQRPGWAISVTMTDPADRAPPAPGTAPPEIQTARREPAAVTPATLPPAPSPAVDRMAIAEPMAGEAADAPGAAGAPEPPHPQISAKAGTGGASVGTNEDDPAAPPQRVQAPPDEPLTLAVAAEVLPNGARLRFSWERRVGAAVFTRGRTLWVVFDVEREVPLAGLGAARMMTNLVHSAEQRHGVAGVTALRFGLTTPLRPRVARSGTSWLVELSPEDGSPEMPDSLLVRREPDASGGGRVVVALREIGKPLWIDDPEIGDRFAVVPLMTPGAAIPQRQTFVQFVLPETAQGVVVLPRGDDVRVNAAREALRIDSARSLLLSTQDDLDSHGAHQATNGDENVLLRFDRWRRTDLGGFDEAKTDLQSRVVRTPKAVRTQPRVALAQLYLAHGFPADAIGVLERVAAEDEEVLESAEFVALRGATLTMLNRLDQAARDLESPLLDGAEDIQLWRAVIMASRGEWEAADSAFAVSQRAYDRLPDAFKARFGLLAAHAALSVGNYHRAGKLATEIAANTESETVRSEAQLVEASIAMRTDKGDTTLSLLDELAESTHRPVSARAELRRIDLALELGEMAPREAIERLEVLRHSWRGDSFELRVLQRLGALYREENEFNNALQAMRDAIDAFPDAPEAPALREEMEALFADLFVGGRANALSPLAALGLFYEFGHLTPVHDGTGRIAEGLARRLVDIDLLDRAAELLDNELGSLHGADRARLGARLAVVHLLNGAPVAALAALDRSDGEAGGEAIERHRVHLRARALAASDRLDDALALIEPLTDAESAGLRADLLWDAKRWAALVPVLGGLLDHQAGEALDEAAHMLVLRQAIALTMLGEQESLSGLRATYGVAMAESAHAEAFDFFTSAVREGDVPFDELPRFLANVGGVEALRDRYRRALGETNTAN